MTRRHDSKAAPPNHLYARLLRDHFQNESGADIESGNEDQYWHVTILRVRRLPMTGRTHAGPLAESSSTAIDPAGDRQQHSQLGPLAWAASRPTNRRRPRLRQTTAESSSLEPRFRPGPCPGRIHTKQGSGQPKLPQTSPLAAALSWIQWLDSGMKHARGRNGLGASTNPTPNSDQGTISVRMRRSPVF